MSRQIPVTLIAGDTFRLNYITSYSPNDGFGLSLKLNGPTGSPQRTTHAATTDSNNTGFILNVSADTTANLSGGLYNYAVVAANTTDSYTVESGILTVEPRADLNTEADLRTHNRRVYEAICAVLENRATQDQASYSIAGRTLTRIPIRDLLYLKDHYKNLVGIEEGQAGAGPKKLFVRFS